VFDPDASDTIDAADNASVADFSIYEGREVTGRVEKTFVRGELVADDGEIVGEPGTASSSNRTSPTGSSDIGRDPIRYRPVAVRYPPAYPAIFVDYSPFASRNAALAIVFADE